MKLWKFIILVLLIPFQSILCQDTLNTDDVKTSELPSFKPDDDIISNTTNDYGWFPYKFKHIFTVGIAYSAPIIFSRGKNVQSPEFGVGKTIFTHEDPFKDNSEKKISKSGELNRNEWSFPIEDSYDVGLNFTYYTPLPINFNFAITVSPSNSTVLYSEDKTKNYLKSDGEKGELKEVTVLYLKNTTINFSAAMMIDLWGGTMSGQSTTIFSTYYLYLGGRYNHSLMNKATSFTQIANADENLRYKNLCDTLQYYEHRSLNNINNTSYIDIGLGANLGAYESLSTSVLNGMVFDFRLVFGIPYNSLFKDTSYKSWQLALQVNWGFAL